MDGKKYRGWDFRSRRRARGRVGAGGRRARGCTIEGGGSVDGRAARGTDGRTRRLTDARAVWVVDAGDRAVVR